ncbi:MAG: hypothetical protein ACRDWS_10495 [Acidimicrobiia bacterium]
MPPRPGTRRVQTGDANWTRNAEEIGALLSGANPNWSAADLADLLGLHLLLTKQEVVHRLEENEEADVGDFDQIFTEILTLADTWPTESSAVPRSARRSMMDKQATTGPGSGCRRPRVPGPPGHGRKPVLPFVLCRRPGPGCRLHLQRVPHGAGPRGSSHRHPRRHLEAGGRLAICTPHAFVFDEERRLRYQGRVDDARDPSRMTSPDLDNALGDLLEGRALAQV